MKITQLHVKNVFASSKTSDLCGLFPALGKIEMEHVISKKLQLKEKAEVSISVIRIKKTYMLSVFKNSSRGSPSIGVILSFLILMNLVILLSISNLA